MADIFEKSKLTNKKFKFFIEWWREQLNAKSLDSFKVRVCNSLTLLYELKASITLAKEAHEHAIVQIEELRDEGFSAKSPNNTEGLGGIFYQDPIIKEKHQARLESLRQILYTGGWKNNPARLLSLEFITKGFIDELERKYVDETVDKLRKTIFEDEKIKNDDIELIVLLTTSLLTHFVTKGFSTIYLYSRLNQILIPEFRPPYFPSSEVEMFNYFIKRFLGGPRECRVIFRVNVKGIKDIEKYVDVTFKKKMSAVLGKEDENNFFIESENIIYSEIILNAVDHISAVYEAKNKLESAIDIHKFGFKGSKADIYKEALSYWGNSNVTKVELELYNKIWFKTEYLESIKELLRKIDKILSADRISLQDKKRIRDSLKYYRLGLEAESFENKILNMWVAIEYIARTPGHRGIISPIIEHIPALMSLGYIEKHMKALAFELQSNEVVFDDESMSKMKNSSKSFYHPVDLAKIVANKEDAKKIYDLCDGKELIRYKITLLHEKLKSPQNILKNIEAHYMRVRWQLARIYRLRAQIVHGVSYNLNRIQLYEHLHTYLSRTLERMIHCLSEDDKSNAIDTVFVYHDVSYSDLIRRLNSTKLIEEIVWDDVISPKLLF